MDQPKEQVAAVMTQILFSKLSHRFFDKYTEYEMQSDFLKTEIMQIYHYFLEELKKTNQGK
jgi:flagellar motor switch protein FliG